MIGLINDNEDAGDEDNEGTVLVARTMTAAAVMTMIILMTMMTMSKVIITTVMGTTSTTS